MLVRALIEWQAASPPSWHADWLAHCQKDQMGENIEPITVISQHLSQLSPSQLVVDHMECNVGRRRLFSEIPPEDEAHWLEPLRYKPCTPSPIFYMFHYLRLPLPIKVVLWDCDIKAMCSLRKCKQ